MDLHPEDLEAARRYQEQALGGFAPLTRDQRARIRAIARRYLRWTAAHPRLHDSVGIGILAGLFIADLGVLLALPPRLPFDLGTVAGALSAGAICGLLHGWLVLNIVTFSLHEGAAHDRIVTGAWPGAQTLRLLANNACRLFLADPVYYLEGHATHHRALGTEGDGSFAHHVRPARLLRACLPMAPLRSDSDFFPWRPRAWTPSRILSHRLTQLWLALLFVPTAALHGVPFAVVALLLVGSWVSFALDRIRESVEHLNMPLDRVDGTRDLGLGFWGMLLGGGPWGQPCHACHHLEPGLAWYQQLALHIHLRRIFTPRQRRQMFVTPVIGVPALLLGLLRGRSP